MGLGHDCDDERDCGYYEVCEGGYCFLNTEYCDSNNDCQGEFYCNSQSHACVLPCVNDENCEYWEYCREGTAETECYVKFGYCARHVDCPGNNYCGDYHLCTEECFTDLDCDPYQHCEVMLTHNECVLSPGRCTISPDCPANQYCNHENYCVDE